MKEKYISRTKDIPSDEHWAVVVDDSFTSYDDGYGEPGSKTPYTREFMTYIVFMGENAEDNVKAWILNHDKHHDMSYKVLHVKPITITKQVHLSFQ